MKSIDWNDDTFAEMIAHICQAGLKEANRRVDKESQIGQAVFWQMLEMNAAIICELINQYAPPGTVIPEMGTILQHLCMEDSMPNGKRIELVVDFLDSLD